MISPINIGISGNREEPVTENKKKSEMAIDQLTPEGHLILLSIQRLICLYMFLIVRPTRKEILTIFLEEYTSRMLVCMNKKEAKWLSTISPRKDI